MLEPLQLISSVVEKRQTLPILSNLLINAKGDSLRITATDLEIELITHVQGANIEAETNFTVSAKKLLEICKALKPATQITIDIRNDKAVVTSEKSRFTLGILPADDYPIIKTTATSNVLKMPEQDLKYLIEKSSFAMAQQDVRYYLNGMLIEISSNMVKSVATDGHRLSITQLSNYGDNQFLQLIIPRKAVSELSRLLSDKKDELSIEFSESYLKIHLGTSILTTKVIDGRYPDYNKVIPDNLDKKIALHKESFKQSLLRASILSNEKYRGVSFQISLNTLTLTANNPEQEEAVEEIEIIYSNDNLSIGFNVGYILDIISVVEEETVVMEFKDATTSALFYGQDNNSSRYVVMPMRI